MITDAFQDKLLDLLAHWEELRQSGRPPSAEELCPEDPELQHALRLRIERRLRIEQMIQPETLVTGSPPEPQNSFPQLEDYEILEVLGAGGMGIVFKARQRSLNRIVAIKMIRTGLGSSTLELQRFQHEAHAVARLHHPHIVQIYEVGEHEKQPYLVLEYLAGGSLASAITKKTMDPRRAAALVQTLALAVQHAHERGIVHRDLKPANVLLSHDGSFKITDYGLAKSLDDDLSQTRTGAILGTPSYMAPEQALGLSKEIGAATDVYALGAILYELLTGRPPFVGESILATLEQVRQHDAVSPRLLHPGLPKDLSAICLKCLEKVSSYRYLSASALAADLQRFLDGESPSARQGTMLDDMARAVSRNTLDQRFDHLAFASIAVSPLPILVYGLLYLFAHGHPLFPPIAVLVTAANLTVLMSVILFSRWKEMLQIPSDQRRRLLHHVSAHLGCVLAALVLVWCTLPPGDWRPLLRVYPFWFVLSAQLYFAMAAEAGGFHIIAVYALLLALVAALAPDWGPALVGLFGATSLLGQGLFLRRRM